MVEIIRNDSEVLLGDARFSIALPGQPSLCAGCANIGPRRRAIAADLNLERRIIRFCQHRGHYVEAASHCDRCTKITSH